MFSNNSFAIDAQQLFDQGNAEYVKENYLVAIHDYNQILREYGGSPALFYNLGRAYQEMGYFGKAILNYERAKYLSPRDPDILAVLLKIQKSNNLVIEQPKRMKKYVTFLHIDHWAWVELVALGLSCLFLLLSIITQRKTLRTTALLSFLFALLAIATLTYLWHDLRASIVITDNAELLISPITGADRLLVIHEGQKVYPLKIHGEYMYVRSSEGLKGWLLKDYTEAVINPEIFK